MNPPHSPRAFGPERCLRWGGRVFAIAAAACGENGRNDAARASPTTPSNPSRPRSLAGTTLRVVTHDSFDVSDEVLQAFEQQTGINVDLVKGGDAVEVVNKAILTNDNPQGDVLFGIDNNLLSRANDANLFEPYESPGPGHRRRAVPARSGPPRHADRPRRRVPQLRSRVLHVASAGRPAVAGGPHQAGVQGLARDREPGDVDSRPGLPARHGGQVRPGRLAGLLEAAEGQRRDRVGRVGAGVLRPVLRR